MLQGLRGTPGSGAVRRRMRFDRIPDFVSPWWTTTENGMTTEEKVARRKLSLLDLARELANVNCACKVMGYSRQQVYEIFQSAPVRERKKIGERDRNARRLHAVIEDFKALGAHQFRRPSPRPLRGPPHRRSAFPAGSLRRFPSDAISRDTPVNERRKRAAISHHCADLASSSRFISASKTSGCRLATL